MKLDTPSITLLVVGLLVTALGIGFYLYGVSRASKHAFTMNVVAWLFIPLFPLVFVLWAFPESTAEGKFFEIKVGGALAAYLAMWVAGIHFTRKGVTIDDLRSDIVDLEKKCEYVEVLNDVRSGAKPKALHGAHVYVYELADVAGKTIALRTGDVSSIHGVDIWVNSENTDMQMARFGERTISSIIRYAGAEKHSESGLVIRDTIAIELKDSLGGSNLVAPAMVVVTGAGELEATNGVKKIFHVASVHGLPASAYKPIERIGDCITNCLRKSEEFRGEGLHSILFSLMGTGTAGGDLQEAVEKLINFTINYLEHKPDSTIKEVSFLTYTDIDLASCRKVLLENERIGRPSA